MLVNTCYVTSSARLPDGQAAEKFLNIVLSTEVSTLVYLELSRKAQPDFLFKILIVNYLK